jgi:hypothetical protein
MLAVVVHEHKIAGFWRMRLPGNRPFVASVVLDLVAVDQHPEQLIRFDQGWRYLDTIFGEDGARPSTNRWPVVARPHQNI